MGFKRTLLDRLRVSENNNKTTVFDLPSNTEIATFTTMDDESNANPIRRITDFSINKILSDNFVTTRNNSVISAIPSAPISRIFESHQQHQHPHQYCDNRNYFNISFNSQTNNSDFYSNIIGSDSDLNKYANYNYNYSEVKYLPGENRYPFSEPINYSVPKLHELNRYLYSNENNNNRIKLIQENLTSSKITTYNNSNTRSSSITKTTKQIKHFDVNRIYNGYSGDLAAVTSTGQTPLRKLNYIERPFQTQCNYDTNNNIIKTSSTNTKCEICDKVFENFVLLAAHQKTHKTPRYQCTECCKGFSQLRNYKYHVSVHRGTKEFAAKCPECGKLFNDKGYLSSHLKIHRNKKEYECPHCPKSFNQRVAFNMHVRIHTGVKPHICDECGKRFSRKMLLKQHLRTHSGEKPYQCSDCGKTFADRSNMTLHYRLHSGVKPFACPLCPKAFTKKHHLKTHLNYHTGCKPYRCPYPYCTQSFTQSSNMRTHAKKCQFKLMPGDDDIQVVVDNDKD